MNVILGKDNLDSLRVILDYGVISSIIKIYIHEEIPKEKTNQVHWTIKVKYRVY